MLLSGYPVDAGKALALGLVEHVVPDGYVGAAAFALAALRVSQ